MGTIKDKIILLVDDEPAILQMCQSILKENGFENIVTANTALSALERMSAKLYVGKDNPRTEPDPYSFFDGKRRNRR